jgi:hypothetical protein
MRARPLRRMTGMTSTGVQAVQFGLRLPGIGLMVCTCMPTVTLDLPRWRRPSFGEGHVFSTCDLGCAYRRSIV